MINYFHGELVTPYNGCYWCMVSGFVDSKGKIHFAYDMDNTRYKGRDPKRILEEMDNVTFISLEKAKEDVTLEKSPGDPTRTYIQVHSDPSHWEMILEVLEFIVEGTPKSDEDDPRKLREEADGIEFDVLHCRCGNDLADGENRECMTYLQSECYGGGGIHIHTGEPICYECYHEYFCSYCGEEVEPDNDSSEEPWIKKYYDEETCTDFCEGCEFRQDDDVIQRAKDYWYETHPNVEKPEPKETETETKEVDNGR